MRIANRMNLPALRLFAAIGATLITVGSGSHAWAGDWSGVKHQNWNWAGTLASGRTLEINGVNGEIVAEPGAGDRIEVTADKHGRHQDPAEVQIRVVQDSHGITICAVYPGNGNSCDPGHYSSHTHNNDVVVDFRVKVPAGIRFAANTVNGGVTTRSLGGPVNARTVNGECDIETFQSGEAHTVNGNVRAVIGKVGANDALEFQTVNGSITLRLPANLSATIDGSTVNGGIHTDFPVEVSGRWGPRTMHGTVGRGGAKLSASTVNGSIHLERALSQ